MIGLASGLLAIAGLFAERAIAIARSDDLADRLGIPSQVRAKRLSPWMLLGTGAFLLGLIAIGPTFALAGSVGGVLLHRVLGARSRATHRHRAAEQVADAVSAMSAGLRAGHSLAQAFAYARDESEDPLRTELSTLVGRIDLGTPVGEALSEWAEAQGSEDARLIVGVLDLHRWSGGDLPTVLDGLAETLRERRAADREVRALTAQARLSGVILGMLPIGFFGFLMLTSSKEMLHAIRTPLGGAALGIGLTLEVLAFLWIRHLLEVR